MFSSASDDWATPQDYFNLVNAEFGFTLDACASESNAKVSRFFSKEQDALAQVWDGVVWCNPPYGRQIGKWITKAYESAKQGAKVVMLIPARTDTAIWHDVIFPYASEYRFIRGRLKFGNSKNAAPFPSALVVFG